MMKKLLTTITSTVIASFMATVAAAESLPQSVRYDHSSVRLLAGSVTNGGWSAGLEISMGPGWKTYWRVPGEAGVPPHFNWKKSVNLEKVDIDWPAPKRYHDEAGESIGYKDQVVFPMTVTPKDASKPVELVLDLFYAVCNDICIPGSAKLSMTLADQAGPPADMALIGKFLDKVPASASPRLKIDKVAVEQYDNSLVLSVHLEGGKPASKTDIFVEGNEELYFRKPKLAMEDNASSVYHLKIDGAKSADQFKGQKLMLTIVDEAGAVTRETTLN